MGSDRGQRAFQNARLRKQHIADAGALFARGAALHQAGHIADARALYQQILQLLPSHFDALHYFGVCEYQQRRFEEADAILAKALVINPRSAAAHSNRSNVLFELGRFEEAAASCDKAIAIKPDYAEAFCNRGNALRSLGRFDAALASADKAIALKRGYAQAFDLRGAALFGLNRFDEALASYDDAIAIRPRSAEALSNRGAVLFALMRFDESLASFERSLAINPAAPDATLGRANALLHIGRMSDAMADCNTVLASNPSSFGALTLLGQCHEKQANLDAALACYDRALALKPDSGPTISNRIFALDFAPNAGFEEQQAARTVWWQQVGSKIAAASCLRHDNDPDPARRIVLGYVSPDFRAHSAAMAFKPVLQNHDRTRFEVVCYACSPVEDSVTADFKRIADKWRNAAQWSDEQLAAQVQADKIDILVDLAGHSAGHRLAVFARKPAPVQVTAWGHATGTGLPTIDYLFSDPVSIPETVRHFFAETIYDLPCALTLEPLPGHLRPAEPPFLARQYVTFGVFNRISKISDEAIAVWADILRADVRCRFLIKHKALDDESVRNALAAKFSNHGITADRIGFLGSTPRDEHLMALAQVDICLDPFPQNGGVSTWEALSMGVPVVAKLGKTAPGRISGAILSAVGMRDWVAESAGDYVSIALKFAAMPDRLRRLRTGLPGMIAASAAGNNVSYARAVDAAYRAMWEKHCKAAPPNVK